MVTGPFQPTREELAKAEALGIDHSNMTLSQLRSRIKGKSEKKTKDTTKYDAERREKLKALGAEPQPDVSSDQLLRQLMAQAEERLAGLGITRGTILQFTGTIDDFPVVGLAKVKSVRRTPGGKRVMVSLEDIDAVTLLMNFDVSVKHAPKSQE